MPKSKSADTPAAEQPLNADRIAAWLRQHPDYFDQHPDLLTTLHLRHDTGAVSLIERQVNQLRKRNDELEERLAELVAIAGDNDKLFDQLRQIILRLLDSGSLGQLGTRLFNDLREPFQVQQLTLISFHAAAPAPWQHVDRHAFEQRLPGLVRHQRALAGKWRRDELRFLFGESGLELSSAALIPLVDGDQALGIIGLGSTAPSHFRSSMDTLFISHLGDVVARLKGVLLRQSTGS